MAQSVQTGSQQYAERVIGSGKRLTIETIADFLQLLRESLSEAETVVIEFDPEVEMDLTALQALYSACRTAATEGKTLMHRGSLPQALLDLTAAAGADRHENGAAIDTSCAHWFGGMEKWES